jgi:signal transduction histidine kinase
MLGRAEKRGLTPDSPFREDVKEVRGIVQEALEKTRSFSQALHPTILEDYGLEKAIERYLPAIEKQAHMSIQFERQGDGRVTNEHAIHVYRILQEALNNVTKHSQAKHAFVRLDVSGSNLKLEVEDDGVGIRNAGPTGLGLIAMRERAQIIGGHLSISPTSRGGTLVQLLAPINNPQ